MTVYNKERILIPKQIREKTGLKTGAKARIRIEKENIIIMPPILPQEFISEIEGCIKEGTPKIEPLKLKKMRKPEEKQSD